METRRWQEEGRKTKEDMARHTDAHTDDLDTLGVDANDARDRAYCQRPCQMETTRRPML